MNTVLKRTTLSLCCLTLSLCLLSSTSFAQESNPPAEKPATTPPPAKPASSEKVVMKYKAEKGMTRRSQSAFTLTMPFPNGESAKLEGKETVKRTYTEVAANGDITYEEIAEESKMTINGQTPPEDPNEKKHTKTFTIRPNGMLVKFSTTDEESKTDTTHLDERLFVASAPIYPDKPIGVGEKWTHEYKADSALGLRPAKAEFEVVGMEKVGKADALRLKMNFAEAETGGVIIKSTFLVEKDSGDVLSAEYKAESFPFGPADGLVIATGNILERRSEGGPLASSKGVVVADLGKPKEKDIDETVKEYTKLPGLFTLYRKKEGSKDSLYMEVRKDQFDKLLLLQATASTGNAEQLIGGDPISDTVFTFSMMEEDEILLRIPNWEWRADPKTPLGRAAKRSFTDSYLESFKVVAKQEERKSYLIDVTQFFQSDFAQILKALSGGGLASLTGMGVPGGYGLDRTGTFIKEVKNFPDNMVIQSRYHFRRMGRDIPGTAQADSRSLPLLVNYNLFALPNDPITFVPTNGYQPRLADPRVGYFTAEFFDFRDDSREDRITRYILRWDLRKKNPSEKLSEPVQPIVFWLDNSIPIEYRPAVEKGLLLWNKAFERVGFTNAIVVKQMPDNADWDHADMRYNVIRWAVTPETSERNGVAIALFRENPMTGQILNASITVDAEWTRYAKLERRKLIDPATAYARAAGMDVDLLFNSGIPLSPEMQEEVALLRGQYERIAHGDPRYCQIADVLALDAYLGQAALRMLFPTGVASAAREKQYTDQLVTEVVAHEFGHILGLRHNFIGSTGLSLEQLKNPEVVRTKGTTASLMDYNAFNISAIREKQVDFFSQTTGAYDNWAIEYGYTPFDPKTETTSLQKIASRSNEPGHAYHSDETAFMALDPRVVQGDISSDPLVYWERVLNLSRYLLLNLDKRVPEKGESYWEFTKAFQLLLANYARAAGVASRYVGGLKLNRNHKGDTNEKPTTEPIEIAQQKQALRLLNTYIFAPNAFNFPASYYTKLTSDPYGLSFSADFPVADQLAGIQRASLQRLFSPAVLRRIANSEFKKGGNPSEALTLPSLFSSVTTNIWVELETRKNIPTLRRQLQREWIGTMSGMVTQTSTAPNDAQMLAWAQLKQVRTRLAAAQAVKGNDEYTRIHIADSIAKIDRALNANQTIGGSGGGSAANLLQMLFGKSN